MVASDRMITGPDVEFEQDLRKFEHLSTHCLALTAGNALVHKDLLSIAGNRIRQAAMPTIGEVVRIVKEEYSRLRLARAEELFLTPIGLDVQAFLQNQARMNQDVVLRLQHQLENAGLELFLLLAGWDSTGAHIHLVADPGTSECFDALGFCAIGTGERHADLSFIINRYSASMPLHKVLFLTYEAKRNAEIAPGVGARFTDMAVINSNGVYFLRPEELSELSSIYDIKRQMNDSNQPLVEKRIDELVIRHEG